MPKECKPSSELGTFLSKIEAHVRWEARKDHTQGEEIMAWRIREDAYQKGFRPRFRSKNKMCRRVAALRVGYSRRGGVELRGPRGQWTARSKAKRVERF